MPKERKLKIVPKSFSRTWRDAVFPEIRIAGKWVQDLGFTCGKSVLVTEEKNKIVIMLIEEPQQEAPPIKARTKPFKIVPLIPGKPIHHLFIVHPPPKEQNADDSDLNTIA